MTNFVPTVGKSIYKHQDIKDCLKQFDEDRRLGLKQHQQWQEFNGGPFRPTLTTVFKPTEEIYATKAKIVYIEGGQND